MTRPKWTYDCHICKKKGLTRGQLENPERYGWTMEVDPPSGPGGYSVFRVYCPECRKHPRK